MQVAFGIELSKLSISNHLKPKNSKEYKLGHSWINESKSQIYSTVKKK